MLFMLPSVMHKLTKLPYEACVLICAPGGLTEMTLMADDYGSEIVPMVTIMHVTRMIFVIITCPFLIRLATYLLAY